MRRGNSDLRAPPPNRLEALTGNRLRTALDAD
jgi:hypothetical protein